MCTQNSNSLHESTKDESVGKPVAPRGPRHDTPEDPWFSQHLFERWVAAPSGSDRCPVSGFSHGTFYREVINGPGRDHVRILDFRHKGQRRAKKYFHAGDLLRWLNRLAEEHAKRVPTSNPEPNSQAS